MVLEFRYSHGDDGYARVWAAEAGASGEVRLSYGQVTTEVTGVPTMHNGTTFLNEWADSAEHKAAADNSPHLRWGVYTWAASIPASLGAYYQKYLGTVRLHVGDDGPAGFAAVLPRSSSSLPPGDPGIALGKPTRTSSQYLLSGGQFAVDGRTYGAGNSSSGIVHTELEDEPFLELDMEAVTTIKRIVIWSTSSVERLDGINVIVSQAACDADDLATCLGGAWGLVHVEPDGRGQERARGSFCRGALHPAAATYDRISHARGSPGVLTSMRLTLP